jgi:hypothetical protein
LETSRKLEVSDRSRRLIGVRSGIVVELKSLAVTLDPAEAAVVPLLPPEVEVAWLMPWLQLCKKERRRLAEVMTKMTTMTGKGLMRWIKRGMDWYLKSNDYDESHWQHLQKTYTSRLLRGLALHAVFR